MEWEDGLLGSADVICAAKHQYAGVVLYGSEATLKCSISKGDTQDLSGGAVGSADTWHEHGYTGTMAAFLEMCRTREMPVPVEESAAIGRVLLAARASASSGRLVMMDEFGQ